MTTQGPLKALRRLAGPVLAAGALLLAAPAMAQQKATDWGWPQPYEKISDKSVQWLKDKGWWPLQIAFQPPWSGQNTINLVMDKQGLLAKRGIEAKLQAFPSGPAINEVMISGRFQVGNGGNFPFTSLVDKNIPIKAIAVINVNLLHAMVVPNDSTLKSLKELKGSNPPATVGIVTGSSAEFYFQMSAAYHGLELGKDVILKNMPPGEQMALPKGLTGVVPWDPTPTIMVQERKNGRFLDTSFPYNVYEGNFYVRQELIDNVPDVVQAFNDAAVEATLWTRLNPEAAVKAMQEDPNLKNYSPEILLQQVKAYNNLYKPTYMYPLAEFWGKANEPIFNWLYQQKRIQRPLKAADFAGAVDKRFMDNTFAKLGWAIPKVPPFIPANWSGQFDKMPYPEYSTPVNTKTPQAFPEKGDLVKPWTFAGKTYNP
jgi:ABC-type nitrate/sulfonate/bicarbonate transport system substrate-binding protein